MREFIKQDIWQLSFKFNEKVIKICLIKILRREKEKVERERVEGFLATQTTALNANFSS